MPVKQSAHPVHHFRFVLCQRVCVTRQGYSDILVSENFGKRFHIHSALYCARGKGVTERMKAAMRNFKFFQQSFKRLLIRAHLRSLAASALHKIFFRVFAARLFQIRHKLSGNRHNSERIFRFWQVGDLFVFAVLPAVAAGSDHTANSASDVYVFPLQSKQLAYAQARIQAEHYAEKFFASAFDYKILQSPLLRRAKTLHALLARFGTANAACKVLARNARLYGAFQRAFQHRYDSAHRIWSKPFRKSRDKFLQNNGVKLRQLPLPQFCCYMIFANTRVFVRRYAFEFGRGKIFQPTCKPFTVLQFFLRMPPGCRDSGMRGGCFLS